MPSPTSLDHRAEVDGQEAGSQSPVYECLHCRYLSGQLLTECPNCGRLNSLVEAGSSNVSDRTRSGETAPVYICLWPECNFRTSQPAKRCPKCETGRLLPEAEMRLINIMGGVVAIGAGVVLMALGIKLLVFGGLWESALQYEPMVSLLIFGIGVLLTVGGVFSLRQNNWLFRLVVRFM